MEKKRLKTIAQTSTAQGSFRYFIQNICDVAGEHLQIYRCDNLWPTCWAKTWSAQQIASSWKCNPHQSTAVPRRGAGIAPYHAFHSFFFWPTTGTPFWDIRDLFGTPAFETIEILLYIKTNIYINVYLCHVWNVQCLSIFQSLGMSILFEPSTFGCFVGCVLRMRQQRRPRPQGPNEMGPNHGRWYNCITRLFFGWNLGEFISPVDSFVWDC